MIIYFIPLVKGQELSGPVSPLLNVSGGDVHVWAVDTETISSSLQVETSWHYERYGFDLHSSDISNYHLHYNTWKAFAATDANWCMIVEESVNIDVPATVIEDHINGLEKDWDVFFPFDRFRIYDDEKQAILAGRQSMISPSLHEWHDPLPYLLGFPWGSSIYFVSKKGCYKLLECMVIRQRVDDEIVLRATEEKIDACYEDVPWFNYMQQPVVKCPGRNSSIYQAILRQSRWTLEKLEQVRMLLKIVSGLAARLQVDLLIQGGTHLGYIRHGGIMPWDDDVDLAIDANHLATFLAAVDNVPGIAQMTIIEDWSGVPFYKIWLIEAEPVPGYPYTFPFIDLWPFNRNGKDLLFTNGVISPGSAQYAYEEVMFENVPFKKVANSLEVLDARYRTWRKGIRVYNYHHSMERCEGFPLRVEISVDENGRMLNLSEAYESNYNRD